jgi:hypothetical protein
MNKQTLIRVSGTILTAMTITLALLALLYLAQHPDLISTLASVSWNGDLTF